ncbi:unnamed protein product [Discosporangium mesarthrocarpum]
MLLHEQRVDRVGFVSSHMHRGGVSGVLGDMYDLVYVDEKWFFVMEDKTGVCLHPAENIPNPPRVQNKRFITKYIFLAVPQPRKVCNGVWFDGKILI